MNPRRRQPLAACCDLRHGDPAANRIEFAMPRLLGLFLPKLGPAGKCSPGSFLLAVKRRDRLLRGRSRGEIRKNIDIKT